MTFPQQHPGTQCTQGKDEELNGSQRITGEMVPAENVTKEVLDIYISNGNGQGRKSRKGLRGTEWREQTVD